VKDMVEAKEEAEEEVRWYVERRLMGYWMGNDMLDGDSGGGSGGGGKVIYWRWMCCWKVICWMEMNGLSNGWLEEEEEEEVQVVVMAEEEAWVVR